MGVVTAKRWTPRSLSNLYLLVARLLELYLSSLPVISSSCTHLIFFFIRPAI